MDPLAALPAEIVLRILEFASIGSIAALVGTNRSWQAFIDLHEDAIYAHHLPHVSPAQTPCEYMSALKAFRADLIGGVRNWKDVCRRRCLLRDAWNSPRPAPVATVIQIGTHPVWRFKTAFDRRFIVSTSQAGGVNVTDLDTGDLLWSLGRHEVRPFAHLEYQNGTAVWDRFGNALEVWRTGLPGCERGEFKRVALLNHETETRGFQLSYDTLCVVSTQGEGFVYDVSPSSETPVSLRTRMQIAHGAVGHLDQSDSVVMYSMGTGGYDFHDKTSGELLGTLRPRTLSQVYHIVHPDRFASDASNIVDIIGNFGGVLSTQTGLPFGPQHNKEVLTPLAIGQGPLTMGLRRNVGEEGIHVIPPLEDDEWGAGKIFGKIMASVSRAGRLLICDWQQVIHRPQDLALFAAVIECEPSGDRSFDLGGWLSIHETVAGKRVLFEVKERIYMLSLGEDGKLSPGSSAFAIAQSIAPQITVPVSFMAVYDDCIMSTFTTLGMELEEDGDEEPEERRERYFPTKAVRVMCLAPAVGGQAS